MKKLISTFVLTLLLLTVAAGQEATPRPPAPPEAGQPDPGRLVGERYTNEFFGVSFSIPRGWFVQDSAARRVMLEMGRDAITANADQRKKAQM